MTVGKYPQPRRAHRNTIPAAAPSHDRPAGVRPDQQPHAITASGIPRNDLEPFQLALGRRKVRLDQQGLLIVAIGLGEMPRILFNLAPAVIGDLKIPGTHGDALVDGRQCLVRPLFRDQHQGLIQIGVAHHRIVIQRIAKIVQCAAAITQGVTNDAAIENGLGSGKPCADRASRYCNAPIRIAGPRYRGRRDSTGPPDWCCKSFPHCRSACRETPLPRWPPCSQWTRPKLKRTRRKEEQDASSQTSQMSECQNLAATSVY